MSNENDDLRSRLGNGESLRKSNVDSSEQTNTSSKENYTQGTEEEDLPVSARSRETENSDDEDELEDTYVDTLAKVLKNRYDNPTAKFTELFRVRYALEPQIDSDEKLQQSLTRGIVTDRDFMYLTQKHLNDFGGMAP